MVRNKIVKKISNGLVFSLCCVLLIGSLSLPIFAVESQAESEIELLSIWVNGVINSSSQSVRLYGSAPLAIHSLPQGTGEYDEYDFSVNVLLNSPEEDETGKYYTLVVVGNGVPYIRYYDYEIDESVTVNGSASNDVIVSLTSETDVYVHLRNSDGLTLSSYTFLIYFDESATIPPVDDYWEGYLDGYEQGHSQGKIQGYNEGFEEGKNQGYNEGYQDGLNESGGTNGFFRLLTEPIRAIYSLEIAPGITVGGVWATLIGISLFLVFLKLYSGG